MAIQTVSDLSIDEFKSLIKKTVAEILAEMLTDPDRDLKLNPAMAHQLEESMTALRNGTKTIPAGDVAAELDLEW